MVVIGEQFARLGGGAPEATSSGEDPPDKGSLSQKEGEEAKGSAGSPEPMDDEEMREKGEEEHKEEAGLGIKRDEGAPKDTEEKVDGAPKKWNVECNGVSWHILESLPERVFRGLDTWRFLIGRWEQLQGV